MTQQFLNRDEAPFGGEIWKLLDETVKSMALGTLSARKLVHAEGPYGLGLKHVPGKEMVLSDESSGELSVTVSAAEPLMLLTSSFILPARDLDNYIRSGIPFDIEPVFRAVKMIAEREDAVLFNGTGINEAQGLIKSPGIQNLKLKQWNQAGDGVGSIVAAIEKLDNAGFHGPYALGLAPSLYYALFRKYPNSDILEIDHVKAVVTDSIVKAPSLASGGVLLNAGRQFVSIIIGQDLTVDFEGPVGRDFRFTLSESIALRVTVPQSVCVLEGA